MRNSCTVELGSSIVIKLVLGVHCTANAISIECKDELVERASNTLLGILATPERENKQR